MAPPLCCAVDALRGSSTTNQQTIDKINKSCVPDDPPRQKDGTLLSPPTTPTPFYWMINKCPSLELGLVVV